MLPLCGACMDSSYYYNTSIGLSRQSIWLYLRICLILNGRTLTYKVLLQIYKEKSNTPWETGKGSHKV